MYVCLCVTWLLSCRFLISKAAVQSRQGSVEVYLLVKDSDATRMNLDSCRAIAH